MTRFYPLGVIKDGIYKDKTSAEKSLLSDHDTVLSVSSSSTNDLPDNFSLFTDSSVYSKKVCSYYYKVLWLN